MKHFLVTLDRDDVDDLALAKALSSLSLAAEVIPMTASELKGDILSRAKVKVLMKHPNILITDLMH